MPGETERSAVLDREGGEPSALRAWCYLVGLSLARQARARQMVWIGLVVIALSVVLVGVNTQLGTWGMHHWRYPRRVGPTYPTWVNEAQILTGLVHRTTGARGVEHAVFGTCHVLLSPDARTEEGQVLGYSAFQVFSQGVVYSIFLNFLLPIWSLAFATEALGGERESNTLVWLFTRPLSRPAIYLAKFVALLPWSVGFNLLGFALLCLAGGQPGWLALKLFWPAVACASLCFSSLFFLLGATLPWPSVLGMVYSFCLEAVLGNMPGYIKRASIGYYTRCMMFESAGHYGLVPDNPAVFLPVSGSSAMVVLLGATVAVLVVGMIVFSQLELREQV